MDSIKMLRIADEMQEWVDRNLSPTTDLIAAWVQRIRDEAYGEFDGDKGRGECN